MFKHKNLLSLYFLCLCTTVIKAITYKLHRYYEPTYGYPDYTNTQNYHYNGYGEYTPYYGHSQYYGNQVKHRTHGATNDKFDYGNIDVSQESLSQIYKMGETSGRELSVPEEWNDLNWVVLIGRKPSKKKATHINGKKMLQIKPTYKQKYVANNPFLPLHKYYTAQETEEPVEIVTTALHEMAGPPYNDEVPLNVSFTHDNVEEGTHMTSASSSMEGKKEEFVASEEFIPSPLMSDPNAMVPLNARSQWKDHDSSSSAVSTVSSRAAQGRSFSSSQETNKQEKFLERPTYTFDVTDAKFKSKRMKRMNVGHFSKRSNEGSSEGSFNLFATVGYPRANFKTFAI